VGTMWNPIRGDLKGGSTPWVYGLFAASSVALKPTREQLQLRHVHPQFPSI
jgi:hypothetical protein